MERTSLMVGILALGLAGLAACSGGGSGSGRVAKTKVEGLRPCPVSQVNPSNLQLPCRKIGDKWYIVD